MPAALRKAPETKTQFFPALVKMLMESNLDDESWAVYDEEADLMSKDPATTAMSSINRLCEDLGEKTTLLCTQPIIAECINSENWI